MRKLDFAEKRVVVHQITHNIFPISKNIQLSDRAFKRMVFTCLLPRKATETKTKLLKPLEERIVCLSLSFHS